MSDSILKDAEKLNVEELRRRKVEMAANILNEKARCKDRFERETASIEAELKRVVGAKTFAELRG